ncbi:hypothetical protein CBP31_13115 [Oceanisphaera profunda]|uniref:Uncharacterized protein n=1 Tax=Oceanisphaera profunda TaxID=1416627 RepID=A0A1Y0D8C9_9GAMM|nr:hypothetical protein [Oceanisphaera profunda]ART83447.1 hypothetical protein CBP31_13115 [Oceanisphaera profunda]
MSQTLYFSLRLLSNCIISQSGATAGDHGCLDYLPGSTLLGVAASRLYADLPQEQSNLLFHSGLVRFGDALPMSNGEHSLPVPLCWHHIKGEGIYQVSEPQLNADALFDPSRKSPAEGKQPKQIRAGHVTASGQLLKAHLDYELKTAINAETGSAATSQLFGYQSLTAGQEFVFSITIDAQVDASLVQQLEQSLVGPVLLGRSRSAQFGQAKIQKITGLPESTPVSADKTLRLWLLSDLALLDDMGNPQVTPTAKALGLPEGSEWQVNHSFIRTRSYTPFNSKRRSYDLARQVISRGSVLVFSLPRALTDQELHGLRFAGQYQESGLGCMAINPPLLANATPVFSAAKTVKVAAPKPLSQPNSLLTRVLQNKHAALNLNGEIEEQAQKLVAAIQSALSSAARWVGLPEGYYPADIPARTQWGEVRNVAVTYSKQPEKLAYELFFNGEQNSKNNNAHAIMRKRAGQPAWKLEINATETLADCIEQALQVIPANIRGQVLALACTKLMSDKRLTQSQQGAKA